MEVLPASHDIEAHIGPLRELDALRKRSAQLRDAGLKALVKLVAEEERTMPEQPESYIHLVTARRVLASAAGGYGMGTGQRESSRPLRLDPLTALPKDHFGMLMAAQALLAGVGSPQLVLSEQSLTCWYLILQELHTVYPGEWSMGCARLDADGWATAYVTSQCVRPILQLEKALRTTAEAFGVIARVTASFNGLAGAEVPEAWCDIELDRLSCSASLSLLQLAPHGALDLGLPAKPKDLRHYLTKEMAGVVEARLIALKDGAARALGAVRDFRQQLTTPEKNQRRRGDVRIEEPTVDELRRLAKDLHSSLGHEMGREAIENMEKFLSSAQGLAAKAQWAELASRFVEAANAVRLTIQPCKLFLSTVLDKQIAARCTEGVQHWEPVELAFATAGYCQFGEFTGSDNGRIQLAGRYVCEAIGSDGILYPRKPFHRFSNGGELMVGTALTLGAIADLLMHKGVVVDLDTARRLMQYFEDRKAINAVTGELLGWVSEYNRAKDAAKLWSTATVVESLTLINQLLDESINRTVLDHFQVIPAGEGPSLDDLFYPDYGLAAIKSKAPEVHRESVALTMLQMRSHVLRLNVVEPLHSLVLHGPAGTGKTTLLEALARSCGVPLVEITPSDLSKGGADAIEQRARAVFEALSLLTRVVILFDEFDPVLRRRDNSGARNVDFLSFLTPGMLPKLKALSESAKRRSVAYALITNLIGSLDDAAVRQGRFDAKVGVYPPDPLSRLGFLQLACAKTGLAQGDPPLYRARILDMVVMTAGLGMTALMADGWFRVGKRGLRPGTPIHYVFTPAVKAQPQVPDPEARFQMEVHGQGAAARRELMQWGWITAWDGGLSEKHAGSKRSVDSVYEEACTWDEGASEKALKVLRSVK